MRNLKNSIFFYLAMIATAMLSGCLDADSDSEVFDQSVCDSSTPAVSISLYRILSKDSFEGISLTEVERGEAIRYDSLAIVVTYLQGPSCPSKQEAVDSARVVSLNTYDEAHPPYTPLNDILEVVLQSEQAIYPVAFDQYNPGNENQFIALLTKEPSEAGPQQFGLWYDNRVFQLTFSVNLAP